MQETNILIRCLTKECNLHPSIKGSAKIEKAKKYEAIYRDIESSFQGFFGTKVKLEAGKRKGKIVMERHLLYLQLNFHLGITAGKMRKEKKTRKTF